MSRSFVGRAFVTACKRRVRVGLVPSEAAHEHSSGATLTIPWLLDNCVTLRHPTGQRSANFYGEKGGASTVTVPEQVLSVDLVQCCANEADAALCIRGGALPPCVRSVEAATKAAPELLAGAEASPGSMSAEAAFPLTSLLKVCFSGGRVAYVPFHSIDKYILLKPPPTPEDPPREPVTTAEAVYRTSFDSVVRDLKGATEAERIRECGLRRTPEVYGLLRRLAADGLVVVEGCGVGEEVVKQLAALIGGTGMPQHTMYGTHWHVQSAPKQGPKNNVAYSTDSLDLHQDLVYHESMPGVQLLHCQSFHNTVKGGLSTFLDIGVWMRAFKQQYPEDYATLTKIPAAFMKDDMEREEPAQYYYATPHIHENDRGEFMKLFWAPAFEAPLPIRDPDMAERYYSARGRMCDVLRDLVDATSPECKTVRFQLHEGDCVIFMQGRMMHGRDAFVEESACSRRLHGAYVELEAFRNKTTSLAVEHRDEDCLLSNDLRHFHNRSFR